MIRERSKKISVSGTTEQSVLIKQHLRRTWFMVKHASRLQELGCRGFLEPEDGGRTFLRNVDKLLHGVLLTS
jgi:hypothetical protein